MPEQEYHRIDAMVADTQGIGWSPIGWAEEALRSILVEVGIDGKAPYEGPTLKVTRK